MNIKVGQKFEYHYLDNVCRGRVLRIYSDDIGEMVVDVEYENGNRDTFYNSSFIGKNLRYEKIVLLDD